MRSKSTFSVVQEPLPQEPNTPMAHMYLRFKQNFEQLLFEFMDNDFPHTLGTGSN